MPTPAPRADGRPLVLGHRGASADAPENTLAAFRLALEQGADGFELDVWRCRSGEIVVHHDADARRTTGVAFGIARTPWAALRRLDAGAWKGERFAGEPLPLLTDVLESFPSAVVNVELKSDGAGDPLLAVEVARIVRSAAAEGRAIVSSFDPLLVATFRAVAPRLPCGMLFASGQRWRLRAAYGRALGVGALHPEWTLASAERTRAWAAAGLAVNVWTVPSGEVERLCAAGVAAIVTNRPGGAREAVRRATGR